MFSPSDFASLGFGCVSKNIPSAPAAIDARLIDLTQGLQNVAWEGSTIIGRCVSSCAAGTTWRSNKNLEVDRCVCGTETPLSQSKTFSFHPYTFPLSPYLNKLVVDLFQISLVYMYPLYFEHY